MSATKDAEDKMKQSVDHLSSELKNIRTGRASPALIESVSIDVYGSQMRLRDVANITSPEPRQLLITPYDSNNCGSIRKGIEKANLGLQPVIDGNVVRITVPEMDESQRKEMVKLCHKKREECKVSIRNARRDANDAVRKQKSEGEIPEDIMKREEKAIQDLTDRFCKQSDDLAAEKEKEVMTI